MIPYLTDILLVVLIVLLIFNMLRASHVLEKFLNFEIELHHLEFMIQQIAINLQNKFIRDEGRVIYRTPDGKHIANSPEELIQKIMNDPDYNSPDQENLKKFFERFLRDSDESDEEEF